MRGILNWIVLVLWTMTGKTSRFTEMKITPPPPPPTPAAPQVIEVVEDEEEVEETIIESTETDQEEIIEVEEIEVEEDDDNIEVPFASLRTFLFFQDAKKYLKKSNAIVFRKKSINTLEITLDIQKSPKKWAYRAGFM